MGRNFKSRLLVLCVIVFSALLIGCSSKVTTEEGVTTKADDGKLVIGVTHPSVDMFLGFLLDGMKEYSEKQTDIEVIYMDTGNDHNTQIKQVDQFIAEGVDAILALPVDLIAAEFAVDRAEAAGIPIVIVNRDNVEREDAYISTDLFDFGVVQMEEVAKSLGGEGSIAIMNGQMGQRAQIQRTAGNKHVVEKYPKMNVVMEGTAAWSREQGKELMTSWIESGHKMDAVVANNDEMAIGAIMAAEEAGILDEILFAGIDGTPDALEFIEAGKLAITVFQDAKGQGETGLEAAIELAKGKQVEKNTYIPAEIVNKNNAKTFKDRWR
ncbi:substrate-binding domain-containing protein [Alkalihalobacillus sp. MEB130]|uniref:substrate-binding domain-containing protein n=1 Tax=Alkalihalobacillus sp. MEB130 TaxID=2976704 RepID=UPI0028DFE3E3|nr:substrate-binding domain-containing protein [Alkalihalobacillus sp. MEB130]MDT8861956.1 substrate-binding domain-containing protein [Alkalihalobacillus sp. MEB130]